MAAHKRNRSRKRQTRFLYFREVKGKTVEAVEVDPDLTAIVVLFQDKTALSFELDPGLTVYPEFSDWKTGNWKGIKRWRPLHSKPALVKWP